MKDWKQDLAEKTIISPGEAFAQRLQQVRNRRGLSQADLSKRLDVLGHPIDRVILTRIEAGGQPAGKSAKAHAENKTRAQNIRLKDVLAICAALNVSPAHMLAPNDDDQYVAIVPGIRPSSPGMARDWIAGKCSLGESDRAEWTRELPAEELLRRREAEMSISQEDVIQRLAELLAAAQPKEEQ